jgi:hypothetical protein
MNGGLGEMNPYQRFSLISNFVSAALIIAGLALFGSPVMSAVIDTAGGSGPAMWASLGGMLGILVVFWIAMTEAIFPVLFRFDTIRKLILGRYYMEGTWLQAEKGDGVRRMAVIDIQPSGNRFIFTGYALNEDLEIESNTRIEFSRFDWPFMVYKYRNSLSDGGDGLREGVGEIQFEMNRSAALRFNGFLQFVRNQQRLNIEGVKLTKGRDVKRLRSLEGRRAIMEKYWALFFNTPLDRAAPAVDQIETRDLPHAPRSSQTPPVGSERPYASRAASAPGPGPIPAPSMSPSSQSGHNVHPLRDTGPDEASPRSYGGSETGDVRLQQVRATIQARQNDLEDVVSSARGAAKPQATPVESPASVRPTCEDGPQPPRAQPGCDRDYRNGSPL